MTPAEIRTSMAAAPVLAVLLAVALLAPGCEGTPPPAGGDQTGRTAPTAPTVTGPDAAAARASIQRAIPWLAQTRVRPAQEGLGRFRFYVMEVHCWYLLYVFADEPLQKERYRTEVAERLRLLGDGRPLLEHLQRVRVPSVIADVLILVMMARHVGVELPAVTQALPELYQLARIIHEDGSASNGSEMRERFGCASVQPRAASGTWASLGGG